MNSERQIELAKEIAFDEDLPNILAKIALAIRVGMNADKGNIKLTTNSIENTELLIKFSWKEKMTKANKTDVKGEL